MVLFDNESAKKLDVPLDHLDYKYIEKCENVKELEKIVKILKSGDEGHYPDLTRVAEDRLQKLAPKSRALRETTPALTPRDVSKDEWNLIKNDLDSFLTDMHTNEPPKSASRAVDDDNDYPPIRSQDGPVTIPLSGQARSKVTTASSSSAAPPRRVKPRDYREWDKLEKLIKDDDDGDDADTFGVSDDATTRSSSSSSSTKNVLRSAPLHHVLSTDIDASDMSPVERSYRAEAEKKKGNEAFHAGDYDEAYIYYTRSVKLEPSVAATFSNRALTCLKLKRFDDAVSDATQALSMEPRNVKSLLRRATAYREKEDVTSARNDLHLVLAIDPENKKAKDTLVELEKALEQKRKKGKRLVIEEVDDEEEDDVTSPRVSTDATPSVTSPRVSAGATSSVTSPVTLTATTPVVTSPRMSTASTPSVTSTVTSTGTTPSVTSPSTTPVVTSVDTTPAGASADVTSTVTSTDSTPAMTSPAANGHPVTSPTAPPSPPEPSPSRQPPVASPASTAAAEPAATTDVTRACAPLPASVQSLADAAMLAFQRGQYGGARELFERAANEARARHVPPSAMIGLLYNMASCNGHLGDYRACVAVCSQLLALQPQPHLKALLKRAAAYEALEKYKEAFLDCEAVLAVESQNKTAQDALPRLRKMLLDLYGTRWREKVVAEGQQVKATPPVDVTSPVELTSSVDVTSVPAVASGDDVSWTKVKDTGNQLFAKGDYAAAIASYTHCLALQPNEAAVLTNRALCHLKTDQAALALADCDAAIAAQPANIKAHFRRALALKQLGRVEASLATLDDVLRLEPHNSIAQKERQLILEGQGRRQGQGQAQAQQGHGQRKLITDVTANGQGQASKASSAPVKVAPKQQQQQQPVAVEQQQDELAPPALPTTAPTLSTNSAFSFLQCWHSLKGVRESRPFADLLRQVEPSSLPQKIGNKLDDVMMEQILLAVTREMTGHEAVSYLSSLARCQRFDIVIMFLSKEKRQELSQFVRNLEPVCGDETPSDLSRLYKLI